MCGKEYEWDDLVWINSSVGLCWDCYEKIPENIRENLADEIYDTDTKKWLDEHDVSY